MVSEIQRVFDQLDGDRLASFAEIRKSPSRISAMHKNSTIDKLVVFHYVRDIHINQT